MVAKKLPAPNISNEPLKKYSWLQIMNFCHRQHHILAPWVHHKKQVQSIILKIQSVPPRTGLVVTGYSSLLHDQDSNLSKGELTQKCLRSYLVQVLAIASARYLINQATSELTCMKTLNQTLLICMQLCLYPKSKLVRTTHNKITINRKKNDPLGDYGLIIITH